MISNNQIRRSVYTRVSSISGFIFFIAFSAFSQKQTVFEPLQTYSKSDQELIQKLKQQVDEEIKLTRSSRHYEINSVYRAIGKQMRLLVEKKEFIKNDSIQSYVDQIVSRLVRSNYLVHPPKLVLIQNSPDVNALSAADGTLIIYIGLIARMRNESQLAFVMAHEMAHFELQHVRQKITESIEGDFLKQEMKNLTNLAVGEGSVDNLLNLKKLWYYQGSNNRSRERQADSLAFEMIDRAGYSNPEAVAALALLDQSKLMKPDLEFMAQLDLLDYPLKDEWFKKRPSIFSSQREDMFFDRDSMISHPDLQLRKKILNDRVIASDDPVNLQSDSFVKKMIKLATFQRIESAFVKDRFDLCFYLTLKLRYRLPHDSYLTAMVAKLLSEFCERRQFAYDYALSLPDYTIGYNEELKMVNEFLHNIKTEEMGELAYYFLNSPQNFDLNNENHYYILWRTCSITERKEERRNVRTKYVDRFPDGIYKNDMIIFNGYKTKLPKKATFVR